MAHKRGSERGVMQVASGLMLAAFGAMFALAGCSSTPQEGENLGSVSQAVVCGGVTCGTGANDCNTYSCSLALTCVVGKPIKNPGDACTAPGKLVNPPGRCAMDTDGKNFVCCTGCLDEPVRGEFVCNPIANQDIKNCGASGADCSPCAQQNCADPTSCDKGECGYTPVADNTACADKSGVCYKGACCAGCIDANGACQPGNLPTVCGVSIAGDKVATCQTCVDADVCTTDICKEGTCAHGATADNTPCADANKCDGAETCQGGVCKEPAGFMCPTDNNACHAPTCSGNNCSQQLLTGTDCPDANLCNGTEKCNNGVCNVPGTPKDCDDQNPCTADGCDPKTGDCIHTPVTPGELCENGDVCDGVGVCAAGGVCQVQPAAPCVANRPNDPCNVYACDKVKGCVVASFTTAACNDSDPCTVGDKCDGAGKCVSGAAQKCDDGNPCTADTCTKGVGCTAVAANENATCDDGNDCSTGDKCVAGKCKSSGGKTCADDTNPCTVATCDPANQVCGQSNDDSLKCQVDKCHEITQCANGVCPTGAPIDCADTNPCTKDACDPATGCTHEPDDTATCTDTDLCTESTSCKAGKCVGVATVCEPVSDCHLAGTCNPNSGFCDAPRAPVGKDCNDATGKCDDKGKCIPNPVTGEGGAGGEGGTTGAGGSGTGGTTVTDGGEPPVVGNGGEGNQGIPAGGDTGTEPSGGKAGKSNTGGTDGANEGGAPETPRHVFVRDPGGCSCSVPNSQPSSLAWLGGLALAGVLARRRRARLDAAAKGPHVS
ncbi:MAG TPA: MYXO-CTERM sorting domain-containing protein [Polyangiaceae bacterium]|nr:MYXO-CTERM sorting domain-containing protein [Polyangiaceae bacterium]